MLTLKSMLTAAALATVAAAETIRVEVNDDSFDPNSIEAEEGDVIEFHFDGGNQSVASGLYNSACAPSNIGDGFFSGFVNDDDDVDVFRITINSTDPIAFFSSQDKACNSGMVGIINPDDDHTLEDYRERASEVADKGNSPPEAYGGELVNDGDDDNNDSDDNNDNDDDNNDDSDDSSDSNDDDDDGSAAGAFSVPVFSLLSAVAVAFALA